MRRVARLKVYYVGKEVWSESIAGRLAAQANFQQEWPCEQICIMLPDVHVTGAHKTQIASTCKYSNSLTSLCKYAIYLSLCSMLVDGMGVNGKLVAQPLRQAQLFVTSCRQRPCITSYACILINVCIKITLYSYVPPVCNSHLALCRQTISLMMDSHPHSDTVYP